MKENLDKITHGLKIIILGITLTYTVLNAPIALIVPVVVLVAVTLVLDEVTIKKTR